MRTNQKIHLVKVPVGGNEGHVWNRLHSEREEICEAMLKPYLPITQNENASPAQSKEDDMQRWHMELLQSRLRTLDAALDRLMSGAYGNCSECGKGIEDSMLQLDAALSLCVSCWSEKRKTGMNALRAPRSHVPEAYIARLEGEDANPAVELALNTLKPFDTIFVETLNSEYRILLLDPLTGRSLIDGGRHLLEPVEGIIAGSRESRSVFKHLLIANGSRLEITTDGKVLITSPIQTVRVVHPAESSELISSAVN